MNVDGSYLDSLGIEGIGDIFRDSNRKILLQFGKGVWVDSAMHAEILPFRKDILVVALS